MESGLARRGSGAGRTDMVPAYANALSEKIKSRPSGRCQMFGRLSWISSTYLFGRKPKSKTRNDGWRLSPGGFRLSSGRGFSGKNTGVGCHALLLGDLPNPGIEPTFLMYTALAGGLFADSAT